MSCRGHAMSFSSSSQNSSVRAGKLKIPGASTWNPSKPSKSTPWGKGSNTDTPRSTQLTHLPYRGSTNVQSHLITSRDCMTKPLSTASQTQTDCSARLSVGLQSLQKQYPKIDLYQVNTCKATANSCKIVYVERLLKAFSSPVFFALCHLPMTSRSSGRTQRLQFSGSKSSCAMSAKELLQPSTANHHVWQVNHRTKSTIFHRYHRHRLGNK